MHTRFGLWRICVLSAQTSAAPVLLYVVGAHLQPHDRAEGPSDVAQVLGHPLNPVGKDHGQLVVVVQDEDLQLDWPSEAVPGPALVRCLHTHLVGLAHPVDQGCLEDDVPRILVNGEYPVVLSLAGVRQGVPQIRIVAKICSNKYAVNKEDYFLKIIFSSPCQD